MTNLFKLFYTFFKIGLLGFGGGYAMLSMIITESQKYGITPEQLADLTALDMVVPGPIGINAATYVGFLDSSYLGATFATLGVAIPSLIIVTIVMVFLEKYKNNHIMNGVLYGIKPAAVGLIAAASLVIAQGILLIPNATFNQIISSPLESLEIVGIIIFILAFFLNIKFKVNPILLTLLAGVVGAFLM